MIETTVVSISAALAATAAGNVFAGLRKVKAHDEQEERLTDRHGVTIRVTRDDHPVNLHELDPQVEAEIASLVEHAIETKEAGAAVRNDLEAGGEKPHKGR